MDDDKHVHGEPPWDGPPALEGEIVYVPRTRDDGGDDRRFGGRRRYRNADGRVFDDDFVEEVVRARIGGWTLKRVAEKYGVSRETVRVWVGEAVGISKTLNADVVTVRAKLAAELRIARKAAWDIMLSHDHPKVKLEALARIESMIGSESTLVGAKAPIKVDVQLTELTEAERELQEMINEAKAAAWAAEQAVIDAASKDPDL